MRERFKIGITMGDPAGIGPELCLRALMEPSVVNQCIPIIFGNAGVLRRVAKSAQLPFRASTIGHSQWMAVNSTDTPLVVDCGRLNGAAVAPGQISKVCGRAAFDFIKAATQAALAGHIIGVVTAPVHKEALHLAGVPYPGHTEIFAALTKANAACMMLTSKVLTVTMVTTHVGYADVPAKLSIERILQVIELTAKAMRGMKGKEPKLGICGLNPHSGEHGLFGKREEERFIVPAIKLARDKGVQIAGPIPPDAAFVRQQRNKFDAIVCQYHDQGHIPFKMMAFDTGVNVTLGLPIIRTSVDHGTAFDIAWAGVASPVSLLEAIRVARRLAAGRVK